MKTPYETALSWVAGRDTGISSVAIWAHMMGSRPERATFGNHPHDPDDFGRCYRLLQLLPEWRQRIGEMAKYSRAWAGLSSHWDELEELYRLIVARPGHWDLVASRRMYDRMHELTDARRTQSSDGKSNQTTTAPAQAEAGKQLTHSPEV